MSIEVMRQARNAFVWNLNTDLDNIPACDQWAKMLRKNIYALDQAISEAEKQNKWGGLTDEEIKDAINDKLTPECIAIAIEAKLRSKND
jgi:hypothetical protein